jgi:hypothetical protein
MGGKAVSGLTLQPEFSWLPLEKTDRMKLQYDDTKAY